MRVILFITTFATSLSIADGQDAVSPLPQAHAHNDYLHDRPLLDALDHGFCSVEADIFLIKGELLVAHSFLGLRKDRTLKNLYLDPLRDRVKRNSGRVHAGGPEFTLLIDIKNNGVEVFPVLHDLLAQYPEVFSSVENGKLKTKAVRAIISGDRPFDLIAEANPGYAGIDGRLADLSSERTAELMPLISDNWRNHFKWRGAGEFPETELRQLNEAVQKAHAAGRRIRFWSIPDEPAVWGVLQKAGVDLINTDNLPGLRRFMLQAVEK